LTTEVNILIITKREEYHSVGVFAPKIHIVLQNSLDSLVEELLKFVVSTAESFDLLSSKAH